MVAQRRLEAGDHISAAVTSACIVQSIPLASGKQVASVTLPDIDTGSNGLHVFALGIGG